MPVWTQKNATIEVWTTREGALSAVGHDLVLEATSFRIELDGSTVTGRVDADSLKVAGTLQSDGAVDRPGLTKLERVKVERSITKEVLEAKAHPVVRFEGTLESGVVRGELELHGRSGSIQAEAESETEGVYRGEFTVHQPDFGIEPYRAFLGALKVEADVTVKFELR